MDGFPKVEEMVLLAGSKSSNIMSGNTALPGVENPHYQLLMTETRGTDRFALIYNDTDFSRYELIPVNPSKDSPFALRFSSNGTNDNSSESSKRGRTPSNRNGSPRPDRVNKSFREIATLFGGSTLLTDALYQMYFINEGAEIPTPDEQFLTAEFTAAMLLLIYGEYKRWKEDDDFSIDKSMLVLAGVFQALGINSPMYFEKAFILSYIAMITTYFKNAAEALDDD